MTNLKAQIKSISFYTETRENNFLNDEELNKELQQDFLNRCFELGIDEDGSFFDTATETSVFPKLLEDESGFIVKDVVFEVEGLTEQIVEKDDWKPATLPHLPNYPQDFVFNQNCVFQPKKEVA